MTRTRILTGLFFATIGVAAALALSLVFYWSLRLNSSLASLVNNTKSEPLYLWSYLLLTAGAIVLFGVNAVLLVYRWRKFGPPRLRQGFGGQAGSSLGSLVGVAASACPICGSILLSAVGIAGGLAAFPFAGLELKALSVGLMAWPIWVTRKDLATSCAGTCQATGNPGFRDTDRPTLVGLGALVWLLLLIGWGMLKTDPALASRNILNPNDNTLYSANFQETGNKLLDEVTAKVLPEQGFQSKVRLSDSVVKLVENGVIDRAKLAAIYEEDDGLPEELKDVLAKPSERPILLTRANANYHVNLLWPLGLANYMSANKESPISGESLFNFASTGGWNLGKEDNGGAYFNKFKVVELTPDQEALVTKIAKHAYRPCCDNSTFYQDCNHGSALLGLLQLGASQGLSEDELYTEALAFNSFWFPHNYIQTGLYFKAVENTDWENVDPKEVMGRDFSAISGWYENVDKELKRLGLAPQLQGGAGCGV